jgi:bifunctional non-homologous end joining protein LigD
MLCGEADIDGLTADTWAFELKTDGNRLIVRNDSGNWHYQTRALRTVTSEYRLTLPDLPRVVLDGEAVVLDANGVPSFNAIQNRAAATRTEFWAFDLLELEGRPLFGLPYEQRRQLLEALADTCGLTVPPALTVPHGAAAMYWAEQASQEGVVAKKLSSIYRPGKRSKEWLKSKVWRVADVVLGGWKPGNGRRADGIGNIMMGIPTPAGLRFCGRVGTGFTDAELNRLVDTFAPLTTQECPFIDIPATERRDAHWIEPVLTAEVRYQMVTVNGHLRFPSWRGLRSSVTEGRFEK